MSIEERAGRFETEEQPVKECSVDIPRGEWTSNVVYMKARCGFASDPASYSVATADPDKAGFMGNEIEGFAKQCEDLDDCLLAQICQGKNKRDNWSALPR